MTNAYVPLANARVGAATWLTFVCLVLEFIVWIATFFMIAFMTPEELGLDWFGWLFWQGPPSWFKTLINGLYAFSIGIVGPLYVAGGFTLYLNRRTILEGWDIEIAFRRMAPTHHIGHRRSGGLMKTIAALLVLFVAGAGWPTVLPAEQAVEPTRELIKERISDIMSNPPFGTKRETYTHQYRWDSDEEEEADEYDPSELDLSWLEWLGEWFQWLGWFAGNAVWSFEIILWTLLGVLIVLVIVYYKRWLPYLRWDKTPPAPTLPSALFGADLAVEPLPDDIAGRAWERWQQGDARGCLSLLYRGALLRIILLRRMQLRDSATEEDCLREVKAIEAPELFGYFQSLTRWWQNTAYADRTPAQGQAQELVEGWKQHFGGTA